MGQCLQCVDHPAVRVPVCRVATVLALSIANGCAVQLDPWKLEAEDTKLLDLLPFLEAVVRTQVPDVRAVVASYSGQDIPTAFK